MKRSNWLWLLALGAGLAYFLTNRQAVSNFAQVGVDAVTATVSGWKSVQQGPIWVPVINTAENAHGIPPDLLARMAYQESHFRQEVIDGSTVSPAGALGILQLMPQYFSTVQRSRPFVAGDVVDQISEAAQYLASLYTQFGDWGAALAAYNFGPGNVNKYLAGTVALPAETSKYVNDILADVPLPTSFTA
jgi:soluble lytic murein transglycosylase-like protein